MAEIKLNSHYASVDVVSAQRHLILRRVQKGERIPVTIRGFIIGASSGDDGTSIEFEIEPTTASISSPSDPQTTIE